MICEKVQLYNETHGVVALSPSFLRTGPSSYHGFHSSIALARRGSTRTAGMRPAAETQVAVCVVGSARTGVLPPVHRSIATHLIDAWTAAGIDVDTFLFLNIQDSFGHVRKNNIVTAVVETGQCVPLREHVESMLQILRPVHVELDGPGCEWAQRTAWRHNVTMNDTSPSGIADCCSSFVAEEIWHLHRTWHDKQFQVDRLTTGAVKGMRAAKSVDFLHLARIKLCFAAADAYAERHHRRYSHYMRTRPDFAFFRAVPAIPLDSGPTQLVTAPRAHVPGVVSAPGDDMVFILPAELKRNWWESDSMSLSCGTVTRSNYPLEYAIFPGFEHLIHLNMSIFGGLVRDPAAIQCFRDAKEQNDRWPARGANLSTAAKHTDNNMSQHCSLDNVDGLSELRERAVYCANHGGNKSDAAAQISAVYEDVARLVSARWTKERRTEVQVWFMGTRV